MLGNAHFYNRTIRKIVVAFGTLFNDINIVRYTQAGVAKEIFKVPLSYGAKEKYLTLITSDPNLTRSIATIVPRISFNLDSLSYDSNRKQVSTIRNFAKDTNTALKTQYAPIPYNFEFSLSIYVRNTEDGTQILEQILPFFTPDFNVTVDFIPDMDQKYDMPIILNSVTSNVEYEGDMQTTRYITWDLTFTAKSYIWPPVKSGKMIRKANTNIHVDINRTDSQRVIVDFPNGTGILLSGESFRDSANGKIGVVDYFSNSNSGILVVTSLNKLLEPKDTITGDFSGATFNISSLATNSINVVNIVTTTDPLNAQADDEFGFAETIKEYPDTL
jgi:hypothetical protein